MKRREFIKKSGAGVVAAGVLAGCSAQDSGPSVQTKKNVTWRFVSSYPRSLDTLFGATELIAKRVDEMTEGRFRIHVYPAGEIVPGLQVMDAVQQGTVQMGQTAGYYYKGKNPALVFDTTVPFGLTHRQQQAWMLVGEGKELLRNLFSDFNIVNFAGGGTGAQMGGWFRREIHSLEELRGLKMRIPGLGGEVMDRLGVNVQVLAGPDVYPALERGAIDATEWVGPYDDEKLGFHKVAKYYYYPGWWEPGPNISNYINKDAWNALPSVYQSVLESAMAEANAMLTATYDAKNPPALRRLLGQGVQLRRFSNEMMDAAYKETLSIMEENAVNDPAYRKIYDSYKASQKDALDWFGTTELGFLEFAHRKISAS